MKTLLFSCFSSHYLGVKSDKWNKTKGEKIALKIFGIKYSNNTSFNEKVHQNNY